MRAYKTKYGKWCAVVELNDGGKRRRKTFNARTKREAELRAYEYVDRNPVFVESEIVSDAVKNYIAERRNVMSPSTLKGYTQFYSHYILDTPFGNTDLSKITQSDCQRFVNELSTYLSPKSVRNIYSLAKAAITEHNQNFNARVTMPQNKVVERHIPTDQDIARLLGLCTHNQKVAIYLAAFGTLRRGEICALKYRDIDKNVVHVHSDMVKGVDGWHYKEIPKTASSDRRVPLPDFVIEEIGEGKPDDFIYPYVPNRITKDFDKLRAKLGLDCRFHDLRHYAASMMHAIGIPDQYIMERGGWSSDAVLKSVYRNTLKDKSDEFSDRTNDYIKKKFST